MGRLKSEIKRSVVLDIFAGSNTTGSAAEKLDRRWMALEKDRTYLAAPTSRFVDGLPAEDLATLIEPLAGSAALTPPFPCA